MVFTKARLDLNHETASDFVTSQWGRKVDFLYVVWRLLWCVFFLAWLVISIIEENNERNEFKWIIYMGNWSSSFLNMNLFLHATLAIIDYVKQRSKEDDKYSQSKMSLCYKLEWILYNIGTGMSLLSSLVFWTVLHDSERLKNSTLVQYAVNIFYITMDTLLVTAIPVKIFHAYFDMLMMTVYVVFSIVYDVNEGTNKYGDNYIYSMLDWTKVPERATLISLLVIVIGSFIVWLYVFILYKIRLKIVNYVLNLEDPLKSKDKRRNKTVNEPELPYFERFRLPSKHIKEEKGETVKSADKLKDSGQITASAKVLDNDDTKNDKLDPNSDPHGDRNKLREDHKSTKTQLSSEPEDFSHIEIYSF